MSRSVLQSVRVQAPHEDDSFDPGDGILRLYTKESRLGPYSDGDFVDKRGIVSIQMENTYLRLDTVFGGRCHVRTWHRAFGNRTVAQLCRAFLTDLHGIHPHV